MLLYTYIFSFTENRRNLSTPAAVQLALPLCHTHKCEHYALVSGPHPAHLWCLLCHPEVLQVLGTVSETYIYRYRYIYTPPSLLLLHNFLCNADKATFIILVLTVINMCNCHASILPCSSKVSQLLIFLLLSLTSTARLNCLENFVNILLDKVFGHRHLDSNTQLQIVNMKTKGFCI